MWVSKKPVAVLLVLGIAAVAGVIAAVNSMGSSIKSINLPRIGPACVVSADGGEVALDTVQMANAATITAVGVIRKMPERAIVVALATALQESKLENLEHGDRDSLGLFQQRPSQGWGKPDQLVDPRYSSKKFYSSLKRVKGWQNMRVTDAAQRVQKSAYPEAYQKWAEEAEVLAKALTGKATGAVACTITGEPAMRGQTAIRKVTAGLKLDWGRGLGQPVTQPTGLTLAISNIDTGWRYAHWLVSHARDTGLERVRFADLEWHAPTGKWQPVTDDRKAGNAHVVVEVFS
ncbi:hypothetical protein AB0M54_40850 [Actinoplanes sp. NPDC051470]|uniref:hypothetical protein n=1 Tax=Actinoplanes sp. NPDC051470 TaxID=3157224 RepID=UPI0034265BC5